MASTSRTTSAASASITTAQRDAANANFTAGAVIAASDIDYLRDRINTVCGHTHTLTDYSALHNYGNTGSSSSATDTTGAAGTDTGYNPAPGDLVTAAGFNSLQAATASVRSHRHSWDDS